MSNHVMTGPEESSRAINLSDGFFELKARNGRTLRVPLTLIEEINSSEATLDDIADMMWFQTAILNTKSFKWVKISDLTGSDLTGWGIWYYRKDFQISGWHYLPCPHFVKKHGLRFLVVEIANTETSVDFNDPDEEVLLIELQDKVFAHELAISVEQEAQYKKDYDEHKWFMKN